MFETVLGEQPIGLSYEEKAALLIFKSWAILPTRLPETGYIILLKSN
jgi:hypothetical protein